MAFKNLFSPVFYRQPCFYDICQPHSNINSPIFLMYHCNDYLHRINEMEMIELSIPILMSFYALGCFNGLFLMVVFFYCIVFVVRLQKALKMEEIKQHIG